MGTTDKTAAERNRRARARRREELELLRLFFSGVSEQVDTGAPDEVVGKYCRHLAEEYRKIFGGGWGG